MKMKPITVVFALVGFAGAAWAGPADYTVVNEPASNNQTHDKLLAAMYGGSFVGQNLINGATNMKDGAVQNTTFGGYSNGAITATRIMDRGGEGLLNLLLNNDDDQQWADGVVQLQVTAKFADDNHTFGWIDATAGNAKNALLNTGSLNSPVLVGLSSEFKWFLESPSTGNVLTSVEADNTGVGPFKSTFFDQMVSYEIIGVDGSKRYVLFWEDRLNGQAFNDYDYNDAVIEIVVVPLPTAALAGAFGLIGVAALRRRMAR
jgi:hypothetical protein